MTAAVTVTDIADALEVIAAASRMNVAVGYMTIGAPDTGRHLAFVVDDPTQRALLVAWLGIDGPPKTYANSGNYARSETFLGTWSGHDISVYGHLPTDDDRPVGEIPALEGVGL